VIRCVRLWTGHDGDSHVAEGFIDLHDGERGDDPWRRAYVVFQPGFDLPFKAKTDRSQGGDQGHP
jgi:hypothetical protein